MSTNIISSLAEENRDLQKQIGCMNGIFQLFDRHYFVTGRRANSSHNQKKLLQGASHSKESKASRNKATEKDLDSAKKHEPGFSDESLRTYSSPSFSCTSTSSSSSLDGGNKMVQSGPPHSEHSNSFQTSIGTPLQQKNHRSVDLRDVIKDSMQREHRALSVKTAGKEEQRGNTMKHIDSPRPSPQFKYGQQRVGHLDGSNHTLAKPQQATRSSGEEKHAPLGHAQKDLPRFSYDERETRDGFKSVTKLKDLPRLSLDSRESSLRSSVSESRLHFILKDLKRDNNTTQMLDMNQEPGSNKRPPSNVVVKLMGLETFPDSENEVTKFHACPDRDIQMRSGDKTSERSTQPPAFSTINVQKDPATPHLSKTGLVMKPTPNSKFPLEPAPWRQLDASQDAPRIVNVGINTSAPRIVNVGINTSATLASSTVYGEIEKRISELEFRKSGKDLRALKQILEAMQKSRKRVENQNREESDLESETSKSSLDHIRGNQVTRTSNCQSNQSYSFGQSKGSISPKRLNASTIISKGARSTAGHQRLQTQNTIYRKEDSIDKPAAKDLTPRNSAPKDTNTWNSYTDKKRVVKPSKAVQTSRAPQLVKAENYAAFGRSSGSTSPRFQGKKPETDKQYHAANPSTEPSKGTRKSSKPPAESNSSIKNVKLQSTSLQRGNYKDSSNNNTRNINHQGDAASVQSESNSSMASQMEMEITSTASKQKIKPKEKDFAARLSENMTFAELAIPATEQPSPVSILDATFYREDSPSPVKKISTAFQEYGTPELDEAEWHLDNLDQVMLIGPKTGDEFSLKPIEKAENLVRRLILLANTHDEVSISMRRIATLCRSPNPDHRYITKMLLASGLIKGSSTFSTAIQLHSSGHVINPNLYHVLEQTEQYIELANREHKRKISPSKSEQKIHRRILFDTVNEILARKLASESSFMTTRRKIRTEKELLMELYSEIDRLQASPNNLEDDDGLGCIPGEWTDCRGEIPSLVLDIERLIFKDLITEVLTDERVGTQDWPKRQFRKPFTEY